MCGFREVHAAAQRDGVMPWVQVDDGVSLYRYKQASLGLVNAAALHATSDSNEV